MRGNETSQSLALREENEREMRDIEIERNGVWESEWRRRTVCEIAEI